MAGTTRQGLNVVVFEEWELRWLREALEVKLATEESILDFLRYTTDLADDLAMHQTQIALQTQIVAAHQGLLAKMGA